MYAQISSGSCHQCPAYPPAFAIEESFKGISFQEVVNILIVVTLYLALRTIFLISILLLVIVSVNSLRQFPCRRIAEDVSISYVVAFLVSLYYHTCYHERRASHFKEVICCSHLVQCQDLGKYVAEHLLHTIRRSHILTFCSLNDRLRQ